MPEVKEQLATLNAEKIAEALAIHSDSASRDATPSGNDDVEVKEEESAEKMDVDETKEEQPRVIDGEKAEGLKEAEAKETEPKKSDPKPKFMFNIADGGFSELHSMFLHQV